MDTLALRPATNADIEFCFDLHRSSFYQYVTEIWGWDEKDQRAIHSRDFKLGRVQIVTANGVDVGRLDVDYGDEEIFLLLIELLANHRGQGLGSRLIRTVLDRRRLKVSRWFSTCLRSTAARMSLYRRLGFTEDRRFVEGPAVKIRMVARRVGPAGVRL